jgi:hypothetical protein
MGLKVVSREKYVLRRRFVSVKRGAGSLGVQETLYRRVLTSTKGWRWSMVKRVTPSLAES